MLLELDNLARGHVAEDSAQAKAERHKEVRRFFKEISAGQAAGLRRVTKQVARLDPVALRANGRAIQPLDAAEAKRQHWGAIWQVDDLRVQGVVKEWVVGVADDEALPPLTLSRVTMACEKFKRKTALAVDRIHPRSFAVAGEGCLERLTELLGCVEREARWPSQLQLLVYVL